MTSGRRAILAARCPREDDLRPVRRQSEFREQEIIRLPGPVVVAGTLLELDLFRIITRVGSGGGQTASKIPMVGISFNAREVATSLLRPTWVTVRRTHGLQVHRVRRSVSEVDAGDVLAAEEDVEAVIGVAGS